MLCTLDLIIHAGKGKGRYMCRYKGHRLGVSTGVLTGGGYDWYWSLAVILGAIIGSIVVDVAAVGVPWLTCSAHYFSLLLFDYQTLNLVRLSQED